MLFDSGDSLAQVRLCPDMAIQQLALVPLRRVQDEAWFLRWWPPGAREPRVDGGTAAESSRDREPGSPVSFYFSFIF